MLIAVSTTVALPLLAGMILWWMRPGATQALPPGALKGANLLVITIDTLRADRVGAYGSTARLTPRLDRLAAEGLRFATVHAHAPLTFPSHASIFTGRYPPAHGVRDNGTFHLDAAQPTLAKILRAAGYQTAAFVGAYVLDSRFGLNGGFDVYDDYYGQPTPGAHFAVVERRAAEVVAPAARWIEAHAGKPWFAWVHVYDPHAPYAAPADVQAQHPDDPYGAEVAYTDATIGAFLEELGARGALARTLIVVTGDHGEALGDHGEKTHGTFAYEATLRVPLIVWSRPAIRPGVFDEAVRHVDVLPTVLDLMGLSPPAGLDGQSLRAFLAGERRYDPPPSYFEALNTNLTRNWAPLTGVVARGFKLIDLPIPELYDLARDPEERQNRYTAERARATDLESVLDRLASAAARHQARRGQRPDADTEARLRSLGYVVGPAAQRKTRFTAADDPKRLIALSNTYDEAVDRMSEGDAAGAIAILKALVARQPDSMLAYDELASAFRQSGDLRAAIATLESAVHRNIADVSDLALLGEYYQEAGDLARSAEILELVVRQSPDYVEACNYLGVTYVRQGKRAAARAMFEKVLAADPGSAGAYNNLGSLDLAEQNYPDAIRALTTALRFDPRLANAYNGLGVAFARTGQTDKAIAAWKEAVRRDPQQYDTLYNLGMTLWDERSPDAVAYLRRFIDTAPPHRYASDIAKVRRLVEQASHP